MAVYQIVKKGDSILREKAKTVTEITSSIIKLIDNMKDTMYSADGVGLAAPQIGISKRVIVVDTDDELLELVNPEIISGEGSETEFEGCLSVPGLIGEVTRFSKVTVKAQNCEGIWLELTRKGMPARVLQHEIDHLEGILFIDKAINIKPVE